MSANMKTTHKTSRSSSVNSTSSTNSLSLELNSGFLELTMPQHQHHRTDSTSTTSTCSGGFLPLTPTCNTPVRKKSVDTSADERQRLVLLRARDN
ncbi:hypothetical protein EPUL_004527 [Erysiphe pulchra]|uniref:Uncharacterized protein n=1 Tax=Erysiphe pulchra TaxID=225359 RepID=A0A2S4PQM4_9PEZI|nr:hypothetical protein EPUL_004527 [Erysiphe pulchra]